MAKLDQINRAPKVEVLPDLRLRITRRLDVINFVGKTEAEFLTDIEIAWGTADVDYPDCRLVKQDIVGQIDNPNKNPNDPPPYLLRVYEQINASTETGVGNADITFDQYDNKVVTQEWIQFSTGTPVNQVPGVDTAPVPNNDAVLKEQVDTDDGTLRRIKRVYTTGGTLSDIQQLRFGGKIVIRTITSLNQVPATPSGYTLVGPGVTYPRGLPVYEYQFAAATGGSSGSGTYIAQDTQYVQSPDQGTTGLTLITITAVVPQGGSNPVVSPGAGYQLVDVQYEDDSGYRKYVVRYAKGQGTVESTIEYRNKGLLVIYSIMAINAAPSAPSPTIGGTVVLIENLQENGQRLHDGVVIYRYKWAEGNGTISTDIQGEGDGAVLYTVRTLTASASAPSYPGTGTAYCTKLEQQAQEGCYLNTAVWHKLPASQTLRQQVRWEKPGLASFVGSPPQLLYQPPITLTLLASMTVDYDVTQVTTTPYGVSFYASLYFSYTPAATGIPVTGTKALGNFLAGASGISGTNSNYNGILCTVWSATLVSSSPSSLPSGSTTLHVDNEIYLTDINGTVVYRRRVTTATI